MSTVASSASKGLLYATWSLLGQIVRVAVQAVKELKQEELLLVIIFLFGRIRRSKTAKEQPDCGLVTCLFT